MPLRLVDTARSTAFFLPPRPPASAPGKAGGRGGRKNVGEQTGAPPPHWSRPPPSCPPLLEPLLLELRRGQVAQRRVDALAFVHVVEEPARLPQRVGEVGVLGQRHLLFLDGPHQPLGVAVLA